MLTYADASKQADRARNQSEGRPIGNNTRLRRDAASGDLIIRLHTTDVVTIHPDGSYTLNTGGWRSVTTKARLNDYSSARVYAHKGVWYVWRWSEDPDVGMEKWPFYDGIRVGADGRPVEPTPPADASAAEATRALYHKNVRAYIRGYLAHLAEQTSLPEPSGGDCWGCCMVVEGQPGKAPMGWGHIWSHFEERYYVPSLLVQSMDYYGNPGFIWSLLGAEYTRKQNNPEYKMDFYHAERALRAYFRKHEQEIIAAHTA